MKIGIPHYLTLTLAFSGSAGWAQPGMPGGQGEVPLLKQSSPLGAFIPPQDRILMGMDPEAAFSRAGQLMERSEAWENSPEQPGAAWAGILGPDELREAEQLVREIKKSYPDWNPDFVASRLEEIQRRMDLHRRKARVGGEKIGEAVADLNRQYKEFPRPEKQTEADFRELKESAAPEIKPSHLYLQGHLAMRQGFELEKAGQYLEALAQLIEAQKYFEAAHTADPAWQPEIVEYRRRKIREDIRRVERLAAGNHGACLQHSAGGDSMPPDAPEAADPRPGRLQESAWAGKKPGKPRREMGPDDAARRTDDLRRRLHETEQALEAAQRREEALRTVLRDLLNEAHAPRPPAFREAQPPNLQLSPPPPALVPVPPPAATP